MTKRTDPAVERNLDFIHRILYAKGYNMASFAKAVGISQQLAYHYFTVRDDMTLYNAQTLLGKLGIEIQPGFITAERPEQEPQTDSVLTIKHTPGRRNPLPEDRGTALHQGTYRKRETA